ncbi:putative inactive receptor kinase [Glycine max]|nr:putative inactive receptor kinase [Glycine max]
MGELLRASAEALGHGILGNSYKAMLNDGSTIVVKRLRDLKPLSKEEFAKILNVIADMKHPNLLSLLAYYHSRDEKLMLYRYAENGNLFSRLHDGRGGNRVPFSWNSRLGVARALVYLQLNHNNIVPHGNLRSSNEDDTVLVSDFGLASLIAQPIAAQHMVVYKSPECLELRFASDRASNWESLHKGAVREEWTAEIFDKEICGQKSALAGMLMLLQIAMRCIER